MRREEWSDEQGEPATASRPDRRTILSLGVGCAVPLLIGGTMGEASDVTAKVQGQPPSDQVADHISREVTRVYHGIRSAAEIRGEHVRTLAVNLDLLGAHAQGRKDDARVDATLRRRIRDRGREATVEELRARYGDLAVGLSVQHGVMLRVAPDGPEAIAALDVLAGHGLIANLRGHKVGLHRLAAQIERAAMGRGATAVPLAVRQKPGDDFLGFPANPESGSTTWCGFLSRVVICLGLEAALVGLCGLGQAAAVLAVAAESLDLVRSNLCDREDAP
jgi:hypothetical protein